MGLNDMNFSFSEVINQLVVMTLIIAMGYAAKKFNILNSDGDKTISALVVNITTPSLIIYSMVSMTNEIVLDNIFIIALMYVIGLSFSYFIASRLILLMKKLSIEEKIIYRFSVVFGNASFLGFPLCYALFGNIGLLYASICSAVQDIFFWTLGVNIMSGAKGEGRYKKLLNPNIFAIIIGIVSIIIGIQLPDFANKTLSTVGSATAPLAFLVVGSGFYGVKLNFRTLKHTLLPAFLKLIAVPLFFILILMNISGIDRILKYVFLLELSMPCAASMVVMARNYERDYRLASQIVMLMVAASIITLPLMVLLIQKII